MTAHAAPSDRPELGLRRWIIWVAVLLGATTAVSVAGQSIAASPPSSHRLLGLLVLLLLASTAHHWPVPVGDGERASLSFVFYVCAAVLYGAADTAVIAATVSAVEGVFVHEHPLKRVFNTGVSALMGGAAGLAASLSADHRGGVIAAVVLAAAAEYAVNVGLVTAMVVHAHLREFADRAWAITKILAIPIAMATSVVPLFLVTWRSAPYVAVTALVPLVAMALYLHSAQARRDVTVLALTDPLTNLGNRRQLNERLARELDRADRSGRPLSVCMLDIDGLKAINDTHGHEAGDEALVAVAGVLLQDGEAFRLGGDEFVLLLPGLDGEGAAAVSAAVIERARSFDLAVSSGTATYGDGVGREDLLRTADEQLYAARARRRSQAGTRYAHESVTEFGALLLRP